MYGTSRPPLKNEEDKPLVLARQVAPQTPNEYAAGVAGRAVNAGVRQPATAEPGAPELQAGARKADRSGWSNAVDGLAGGAKAVAGAALVPHAAAADAVRNAAAMVAGGDPNTLDGGSAKYRDKAFGTFSEGLSQASGAAQNIKADVRDVLGVKPLPSRAQTSVADSQGPAAAPSAPAAATQGDGSEGQAAGQVAATGGSEWQSTGIGRDQAGGEIAMRIGAGGVPEFTNENATPGATTGAAPAQEGFGARRLAAPSVGDGVGTFTQLEPGSAQLAIERFGRANEILAGTQRPRELGDNGGRLTVVRDSSRAPTMADLQNARYEQRLAETEALRAGVRRQDQLAQSQISKDGTDADQAERRLAMDSAKGSVELAAAESQLRTTQELEGIRQQLADPNLSNDQRAALEATYYAMTGQSRDRFITVKGGRGMDGAEQPSRVFDTRTQRFVDGADQEDGSPAVGAVQGGYRFKGGNPADQNNWEKV